MIGATAREGSVGRSVFENLRVFPGEVFPVNPGCGEVLGRRTFPTVRDIGQPVDLAVIITPAATVPTIIADCVEAGVKGAVIISAGFKETGAQGAELERQILAEARRNGMRIIGPNCLGVITPRVGLNATFATAMPRPGSVAFLSQSGALCAAILDWSFRENVGFSAFVSTGSMLDVGWGDLIRHFGDDSHTASIVIYMESVGDARSFLCAAREVAARKPVVVIKVGRTEAAARAAASHTGAMTGSDAVLDAALRQTGVLRVDTIEEVFDIAEILAKQRLPAGPRLAIVTNAGGPGALATDAVESFGGQVTMLGEPTLAALNQLLPPHWSHGNPVDVLGDAWLRSGWADLRILRPIYAGETLTITLSETVDGSHLAEARGPEGKVRRGAADHGSRCLARDARGGGPGRGLRRADHVRRHPGHAGLRADRVADRDLVSVGRPRRPSPRGRAVDGDPIPSVGSLVDRADDGLRRVGGLL